MKCEKREFDKPKIHYFETKVASKEREVQFPLNQFCYRIGRFGFFGKAEPKFHQLPLETLCTKFGAFVRPVNINAKG